MSKNNLPKTTVIIPVYADWNSLSDCIESLFQHLDDKHSVILVNDHGPDHKDIETKIKNKITGRKNYNYFSNTKNMGFLKTCNRAVMELDNTDNNILLLNSDTIVTENFLEELTTVLYLKPNFGCVSPRSNNASLATIPLAAAEQKGISKTESYKVFLKINSALPRFNTAPTGHGFCLLIRREVINKFGLFDEVFGKGYGEENDFSMRLEKQNILSIISNRSYVYHLEARSFTPEKKKKILEKNLGIIYERYPDYRSKVRKYMENQKDLERKLEKQNGIKYRLESEGRNSLRSRFLRRLSI